MYYEDKPQGKSRGSIMPYRNPGGADDNYALDDGFGEENLKTLPDAVKKR
jgi:hypothetical protein